MSIRAHVEELRRRCEALLAEPESVCEVVIVTPPGGFSERRRVVRETGLPMGEG